MWPPSSAAQAPLFCSPLPHPVPLSQTGPGGQTSLSRSFLTPLSTTYSQSLLFCEGPGLDSKLWRLPFSPSLFPQPHQTLMNLSTVQGPRSTFLGGGQFPVSHPLPIPAFAPSVTLQRCPEDVLKSMAWTWVPPCTKDGKSTSKSAANPTLRSFSICGGTTGERLGIVWESGSRETPTVHTTRTLLVHFPPNLQCMVLETIKLCRTNDWTNIWE